MRWKPPTDAHERENPLMLSITDPRNCQDLYGRQPWSFATHEDWRYTYFLEYNAEVAQRSEMKL